MITSLIKNKIRDYFLKFKKDLKDNKSFLKSLWFYLKKFPTLLFIFLLIGVGFFLKSIFSDKNSYFTSNAFKSLSVLAQENLFLKANLNTRSDVLKERVNLEDINLNLIQGNSLIGISSPTIFSSQVLGAMVANFEPENREKYIIEYIVEEGDSLKSLANKFNISLNTILWANDLNSRSIIRPGQKITIPPVSGVVHLVKSGDTISEIARFYRASREEILAFNNLINENDIYIGDVLIVPNGIMSQASSIVRSRELNQIPISLAQFIAPIVPPYIITQITREPHGGKAVDFTHEGYACGKPVVAVAGGEVQKTGYHRIAGNYVRILHPNGIVTFYGHLNSIFVTPGQQVSQGTIIGLIGNTGFTIGPTGCHVHFEVRGAINPFAQ